MADPHKIILDAVADHVESDAAFTGVQVRREPLPRRQHMIPDKVCTLSIESPRFSRYISIGEFEYVWVVQVLFALRLTQRDHNVQDILGAWIDSLRRDFIALNNPLKVAADAGAFTGSGSHYLRTVVARYDVNPAPLTDSPRHHGMALTLEAFTCDSRS